jgi:hypothetical protein
MQFALALLIQVRGETMPLVMMKRLIHSLQRRRDRGVKQKWKSWNIIVIQVASGESRTFADAVVPESESWR